MKPRNAKCNSALLQLRSGKPEHCIKWHFFPLEIELQVTVAETYKGDFRHNNPNTLIKHLKQFWIFTIQGRNLDKRIHNALYANYPPDTLKDPIKLIGCLFHTFFWYFHRIGGGWVSQTVTSKHAQLHICLIGHSRGPSNTLQWGYSLSHVTVFHGRDWHTKCFSCCLFSWYLTDW